MKVTRCEHCKGRGLVDIDDLMKQPRVEFYRDAKREHRWRVVAANGNILADSGEGYKTKRGARAGLKATANALHSN